MDTFINCKSAIIKIFKCMFGMRHFPLKSNLVHKISTEPHTIVNVRMNGWDPQVLAEDLDVLIALVVHSRGLEILECWYD